MNIAYLCCTSVQTQPDKLQYWRLSCLLFNHLIHCVYWNPSNPKCSVQNISKICIVDVHSLTCILCLKDGKYSSLILVTLWLPDRGACQNPDILYFSSFEAGIANAISSFKWRKIHKCSIYLTKICVILWLRSLTNDDGNFRHVW